jgi:hypothetical protein
MKSEEFALDDEVMSRSPTNTLPTYCAITRFFSGLDDVVDTTHKSQSSDSPSSSKPPHVCRAAAPPHIYYYICQNRQYLN